MTYGTVSADVAVEKRSVFTKTSMDIKLTGYSSGTLEVPHLIRDKVTMQENGFYFTTRFTDDIVRNLFEYFDKFEKYFKADPDDLVNARGYNQVFVETMR